MRSKGRPTATVGSWLSDVLHAGGTGGLNWHVHAWYSLNRWRPTIDAIEKYLLTVEPTPSKELVLIGGSAGWMMSTQWLQKFSHLHTYDIDPFAHRLFQWRHGQALKKSGITLTAHRQDAIETLPLIARNHPDALFWFDNVLGQHRFRLDDEDLAEKQMLQIQSILAGKSWGSLHDRYSGPLEKPLLALQVPLLCANMVLMNVEGGVRYKNKLLSNDEAAQQMLVNINATGTWQDHGTTYLLPMGIERKWIPWAFKPLYGHWLEIAWVKS
ncbi:MAG: hypothetical protein EBS66_17075 [Betaproteobacteria bacterium]|nr:hypothetical protein [Betaproteobacteria bacterium]NBY09346.1 hypothetical protein [Betaproteobacteria bacterium]